MRTYTRYVFGAEDERKLLAAGVSPECLLFRREKFEDGPVFQVEHEDPNYSLVERVARKEQLTGLTHSEYSQTEIARACYCEVYSTTRLGFPEPSGDMRWIQECFSLENYCPECQKGLASRHPLRIKKEPRWTGRRNSGGVYWLPSTIIVDVRLYSKIIEEFGIPTLAITNGSGNRTYDDAVQLIPQGAVPLESEHLKLESTCSNCKRPRFAYSYVGFPPNPIKTDFDFFESEQWYGSGAESYRTKYVSSRLREALQSIGSSLTFRPINMNH